MFKLSADVNESQNKVPTITENENKNKFPPEPQGAQPNGNRNISKKNGDVDNDDTKKKLYVDITQLANVSTEGLDLIVGMASQKCVENISSMATITMGAPYTRGANCKFFHPKLCHNSVDFFKCHKVYCNYYHLVGMHRPNSGNTVNNNDQFINSQKQGHSDGDNMINNYERFPQQ